MLKTRLKDYIIETNIGNALVFEMYNTTISRGEGVKVIRKVKTRDKVTIIKAAIFVLTLTALAIIVLVYSNFSLGRSLDTISYRQLENIANSRIRSVNLFLENKFRVLDMMSRYISENGEDDFWENASDLSIEANDFIVLGVSDVRGNAYCKTCDKDEIFEDIFPDADKVLKYGYKAINVTDECGGVPAFVVAVPIYKHRHITGAVFAGVSIEKIEEILETSGSNKNIAIFVADENEKTIVGNEEFNSHKNVESISDYFENNDNLESVLSDIKEHKSGHSKIVHDGEDTYVLYQNTNVNHYSIFVTIGKTDAYKDAAESQRQYRILSEILIAFIIVLTSVSVFVLVGNARRLIKLSEIEISKKDYKEEIYRSAILSNCLAFWEVNLTDGTVVEISDLSFIGEELPENLIPDKGKTVRYDELMDWLADKMDVVNRERYDMVNSVDYLLSCYNNDERMVELFCQANKCGGMMCRKMYYMHENKFDHKIHAVCIIHDITEKHNYEKELKALVGELKDAKIKNSTSQMQPHFLYNALASIREIILDDPQYASDLVYDFTQTYGGLPYNNVSRCLFHVLEMYDYETGYMPGLDYSSHNPLFGNTCASSVTWGLAAIDPNLTASSTHSVCPGGGLEFVGNIKGHDDMQKFTDALSTTDIIKEIGDAETYECYAAAKPADALLKHVTSGSSGNHCMMVVNVNTVRNADGTIDPAASTLDIQDQWGKIYVEEGVGYCGRHKTFTFQEMKDDDYIPLRARALVNYSGHEVAKVEVTKGAETFADMKGVRFTANYRAVVFSASLISESGTTVYYRSMENTNYSGSYSMAAVVPSANALTEVMRKDRNYTFVLQVRLADGELFDVASIPLTLKDLE